MAAFSGKINPNTLFSALPANIQRGLFELNQVDIHQLVADSHVSRADLVRVVAFDDEVAQCVETRTDKLLGVDWRIEHPNENIRNFLTNEIKKHYVTLAENALNARWYGYDVQEKIYQKYETGEIGLKSVIGLPFRWFGVTRDKELQYYSYGTNKPEKLDTFFKFSLSLNKPTYDNPRGNALIAKCFWPSFFRSANWQFYLQFLEKGASPMLWGSGNNVKNIADALEKAVQTATIAVDPETKLGVLESANRGLSYDIAEDRLTRRIQKTILGQTLTSDIGSNGNGSRALGDVHNSVRADKTFSDLKLIQPVLQNCLDALCFLNFPGQPIAEFVYAADRDLEVSRANRDAALMNTKRIILNEQYFIREYGFIPGDISVLMDSAVTQGNLVNS